VARISRVFAHEWQVKDLRDRECVRVANIRSYKEAFLRYDAGRDSEDAIGNGASRRPRWSRGGCVAGHASQMALRVSDHGLL